MWKYDKKLQYPVNIVQPDLKMAKNIVTQFGGSNGELAAALRYLTQRYTMPDDAGKALLTDIGTEELAPRRWILKKPHSARNEALLIDNWITTFMINHLQ